MKVTMRQPEKAALSETCNTHQMMWRSKSDEISYSSVGAPDSGRAPTSPPVLPLLPEQVHQHVQALSHDQQGSCLTHTGSTCHSLRLLASCANACGLAQAVQVNIPRTARKPAWEAMPTGFRRRKTSPVCSLLPVPTSTSVSFKRSVPTSTSASFVSDERTSFRPSESCESAVSKNSVKVSGSMAAWSSSSASFASRKSVVPAVPANLSDITPARRSRSISFPSELPNEAVGITMRALGPATNRKSPSGYRRSVSLADATPAILSCLTLLGLEAAARAVSTVRSSCDISGSCNCSLDLERSDKSSLPSRKYPCGSDRESISSGSLPSCGNCSCSSEQEGKRSQKGLPYGHSFSSLQDERGYGRSSSLPYRRRSDRRAPAYKVLAATRSTVLSKSFETQS
mmetsp:Transcript_46134/g.76264  ORF Transcript_46134/g.76264 Transcript_46134/m.76264 type:complete len:399 (+) Transcript_46134:170-1366(+)